MTGRCFSHSPARPKDAGQLRGAEAAGRPHTLCGRSHGDPFPLPLFARGGEPRPAHRHRDRFGLARRCNEAVRSLITSTRRMVHFSAINLHCLLMQHSAQFLTAWPLEWKPSAHRPSRMGMRPCCLSFELETFTRTPT